MFIHAARAFFGQLKKRPENFYIIHYSCQSLYDDNEGLSPRITSIAVVHYSTEQTVSFSTHAIAEELGVGRDDVRARFDDIERRLLSGFFEFVRDRRDKYWVHWNMRNLTYGFEHIEHRFRTLGGENPPTIPVERRLNLSDMLSDRFGDDYAKHPKMKNLMEQNGGIHRDFLGGAEEIEAFNQGQFIRMHASVLCKVGFFHKVMKKVLTAKLRTGSKGFLVWLDRFFESRSVKVIALSSSVIGILGTIFALSGTFKSML
jgi:hypothetical protein